MKRNMTGFLSMLLTLTLLVGCTTRVANPSTTTQPEPVDEPPAVSEDTRPAPVIDTAGGYSVETEELHAENEGQQIYGLLYRPVEAEGARPVVIYAHGFSSSYRNGDQYAQVLAAQGYLVYCFDFRGGSESSRSEGSNLEMSVFTEQSDLEAVIAMMKARSDVDNRNIFLLGASQGGMVSAMTTADNADDIAGAVLLYPAFVLVDDARERFSSIDEVPESYRHLFMTVGRPYFEKLFDYDVYGHIQNYSKDILLIHGDRDSLVPLSYSERALEVYPSAELEIIPGAGHGFYGDAAQRAIDRMSEYFSQHLAGQSSPQNSEGQKIKMTAGDVEVLITLNDSKAAADLVAMLPLEMELIERNSFAKGMTLPAHLSNVEDTTREYEIGDFGYWDAGPDLAIFYDDIYEQTIVDVIPLGHAETGAEAMTNCTGTVRLELVTE